MAKIGCDISNISQSGDETAKQVLDIVAAALPLAERRAEVIRDNDTGKVIKVFVNLPDDVDATGLANATTKINENIGVAVATVLPVVNIGLTFEGVDEGLADGTDLLAAPQGLFTGGFSNGSGSVKIDTTNVVVGSNSVKMVMAGTASNPSTNFFYGAQDLALKARLACGAVSVTEQSFQVRINTSGNSFQTKSSLLVFTPVGDLLHINGGAISFGAVGKITVNSALFDASSNVHSLPGATFKRELASTVFDAYSTFVITYNLTARTVTININGTPTVLTDLTSSNHGYLNQYRGFMTFNAITDTTIFLDDIRFREVS